jgi:ribosomal protein S14
MPSGQCPKIAIGSRAGQERFLREYKRFIKEHCRLHELLTKVFIRTLPPPAEKDVKAIDALPDSDPGSIAFRNKLNADMVVFYFGRLTVDDFNELFILSGNGYGFGALKILRTMYEHVVTATFIAKNPSEVRAFIEDEAIERWKLWQRIVSLDPDMSSRYSEETRNLEANYNEARSKRRETRCSKCGQPKTQEAWTRATLADMAKKADPSLARLYGPCYLEPTFHAHATAYGLGRRLRELANRVVIFEPGSQKEGRMALRRGHQLIVGLLGFHNEYFTLGLGREVQERVKMFSEVWEEIIGKDFQP